MHAYSELADPEITKITFHVIAEFAGDVSTVYSYLTESCLMVLLAAVNEGNVSEKDGDVKVAVHDREASSGAIKHSK